jgi:exopolysaccharide biosynthesis polyprenyl glycosylphosphotransferase
LLSGDFLAGYVAYKIVFDLSFLSIIDFQKLIIVQIIWALLFYFSNLYDTRATLSRFEEILSIVPLIYFTLVVIITLDVFQFSLLEIKYIKLFKYGMFFASNVLIIRFIFHSFQKILLMKNFGLDRAFILGINRRGLDVFKSLNNYAHHGINPIGFIQAYDDPNFDNDKLPLPIIGHESSIKKLIQENKIEDIIIALDKPTPERVIKTIVTINDSPISIKVVPDMYEVVMGMARTNQLVGLPLIDINLNIDTFYSKSLKRIIDIIFSAIGIITILPIWILVIIFIKIDSKGPIFYTQERCGKNNQNFHIIKFRSMITGAENETGPVWSDLEDERITRIGKFLRRLHIDETPQLFNILKGEMSIVGPRPERPYFIKKLNKEYPFYHRRLKIRPGITGWAQIKQPFDTTVKDVRQKLKFDFYYIENLSFKLDLKIIINTIWVVFWGHPR